MSLEPALSGEIPLDGIIEVLRDIESKRITGRLRYTVSGESGEVELVSGQLALDQDSLPDGSDPVERLLALRAGIFVVHQRLPPLAVSQGDDEQKKGSLAVHAPSDLMTYCETAGLTGTLKLVREGRIVEMVYESGELLAIRVDGQENADLSHVFSWDDGRFEIKVGRDVRSLVPDFHQTEEDPSEREPTTQFVRPRHEDTGKHFLKVFEVALTDIVEHRAKATHKGKGTTPPPVPTARPRPPTVKPPAPKKREPTVRIVYFAADDDGVAAVIDQQSGRSKGPARGVEEKMAKKEKKPVKKPSTTEPKAAEKDSLASKPETSEVKAAAATSSTPTTSTGQDVLISAGWALAVIAVGLGILALLAGLPPV